VELGSEINALNRALYSPQGSTWDPKALRSAFHAFIAKKQKSPKAADSLLQPLYKT
jgi:hypothetical protein